MLQHRQEMYPELITHQVNIIEKDNILFELYGEKIGTNSFHHQVIDRLGEGLTPIAQTNDGVIEAFQMKTHKFLYGIQWHPEMMKIFESFVEACSVKE